MDTSFKDVYGTSFISCTAKLWNSLSVECLLLISVAVSLELQGTFYLCILSRKAFYMLASFLSYFCNSMSLSGCSALNPNQRKLIWNCFKVCWVIPVMSVILWVFFTWKTLQVLQKTCIKIMACAIYTYIFFSYPYLLLLCWKINSCCDCCFP